MLILPMAVKGMVVQLQVSFKDLKPQENFLLSGNSKRYLGEFQVNRFKYFTEDVDFEKRKAMEKYLKMHPELLTEFLRQNMHTQDDKIYVMSQNYQEKDFCTRYQVPKPPKRGNVALDKLYGKLLNDLRLNVDEKEDDSFLSFQSLGLKEALSKDNQNIVNDGVDVLEYLEQLNFDTLDETNNARIEKAIKARPKKFQNYYREMAIENKNIYKQIFKLHQEVYDTTPVWPKFTEQQKIYIKSRKEMQGNKAA